MRCPYYGRQNVPLVEGNKTLLKVPCPKGQVTPPAYDYILLFLLENIHSKKLVFLIASGGKKWGFHYPHDHKWWEKVVINGGEKWGKVCRGDYPPCKAPLTL